MNDARPGSGVPEQDRQPPQRFQDEQVMHLDRGQLVAETSRPVPRAALSARAATGLWALRVVAVLVSLMVIYTFIDQLHWRTGLNFAGMTHSGASALITGRSGAVGYLRAATRLTARVSPDRRGRRSLGVRLFVTLHHLGHGGGSVRILRWQMAVATAWLQLPKRPGAWFRSPMALQRDLPGGPLPRRVVAVEDLR